MSVLYILKPYETSTHAASSDEQICAAWCQPALPVCDDLVQVMRATASEPSDICTALQVLRQRTQPLHARLDHRSTLSALLAPGCTVADYGQAMVSLAGAYQGVDAALAKGASLCPPALPPYIPRLPYVLADIERLGLIAPVAPNAALAAPTSLAGYLGMRYVIEGSNLGSRVILRALKDSDIALPIGVDTCYWSFAQTWQTSWPLVLRALAELHSHDEWEGAANSACLVFEHFICLLTPEGN